ncbi:hypothetical protein AVEN_67320-1 [Araneus ventricosus]|uniref:Uncharacterized protein n=1 Tax=Araneus ventricosus TaxID=182803 RepID=A0A4Y2SNQ3_ARAVE|nr:hypothetical protein AVEN_67320-1 [Araneus ventricosus]
MASPVDNSKIITPFIPPLSHIALIQVAVPFFNRFDFRTLKMAFAEIQNGNSKAPDEGTEENDNANYDKAKESLLFIPGLLRERVMEAVASLRYAVSEWQEDHSFILGCGFIACTFFMRTDGIIDRTKTAEKLILNKNFNIKKRFHLACMYCLGDSIRSLWAELEADGRTASFENTHDPFMRFCIRWIRDGSHIPWTQAVREYFTHPRTPSPRASWKRFPRFAYFLPLLRPEERRQFLLSLGTATFDDLLLSLHTMTKQEEEQVLNTNIRSVLLMYLYTWPLQGLFLETAEKVWNYIDPDTFRSVLHTILYLKRVRKYPDYCEIFEGFWKMSPEHFREHAKKWPGKEIDSCLSEIKKRKLSWTNTHQAKKKFISDADCKNVA